MNNEKFPPDWPKADEPDIRAVASTLRSGRLTIFDSEEVRKFEKEFATYIGTDYATFMTNCTSSISCALMSLGNRNRKEVVLPAYTYAATAMAVISNGYVPVFADVDLETYNICPKEVKKLITEKTLAVIGVHLFGNPCNIPELSKLRDEHEFALIEDCAQATGARLRNRKVGSFGTGCHSFGENKILRIGEGGAITTDEKRVNEQAKIIRHEGECWLKTGESAASLGDLTYNDFVYGFDYPVAGFNFRPLSYQAAFARCRLRKIEEDLHRRRQNASYLMAQLKKFDAIVTPHLQSETDSSWFSFVIRLESSAFDRDTFLLSLIMEGIPAGVHYPKPLPNCQVFQKFAKSSYPNTTKLCEQQVALPVYPSLSRRHMQLIVEGIEKVLKRLSENQKEITRIARKRKESIKIRGAYSGLYMIV